MFDKLYIKALKAKYEAEIFQATATLNLYLSKGVAIGEHPDLIEIQDECLDKIAHANDKLNALNNFLLKYHQDTLEKK